MKRSGPVLSGLPVRGGASAETFDLGTAEKTVKIERGRVMGKMQAESLAHLVRMADLTGVLPEQGHFGKPDIVEADRQLRLQAALLSPQASSE